MGLGSGGGTLQRAPNPANTRGPETLQAFLGLEGSSGRGCRVQLISNTAASSVRPYRGGALRTCVLGWVVLDGCAVARLTLGVQRPSCMRAWPSCDHGVRATGLSLRPRGLLEAHQTGRPGKGNGAPRPMWEAQDSILAALRTARTQGGASDGGLGMAQNTPPAPTHSAAAWRRR
jgi:hypothetical protein